MGTKNNPGAYDCYAKAMPDEPVFVLLARDAQAPTAIRCWAGLRSDALGEGVQPQVIEALDCAHEMEAWRKRNDGAWRVQTPQPERPAHPPGDYAIVELMGHVKLVGRVEEVERFGTKLLQVEPLYRDTMLPPVLYGSGSIYGITPCTAEVAFGKAPQRSYSLPLPIRATLPAALLEAPKTLGDVLDAAMHADEIPC